MVRRHLEPLVLDSLREFPVVLITGARQVGKSTLVQSICREKWKAQYLTLDDRNLLDAALTDPDGFIAAHPGPVAIDEVQKAPDLLRAVKLRVDRDRRSGSFLLTGSANLLTLKKVSETLAGRVALHEMCPFSFSELQRASAPPQTLEAIFRSGDCSVLEDLCRKAPSLSEVELLARIIQGGYPDSALSTRRSMRIRWFEAYRKTYIERDVREIQNVERLPDFSRLMTLVASRTGQVLNAADLGRDAGLPYVTLRRYLNLLEQTYQISLVSPYFSNVSKRMVKAPKLYWTDTGMASHLLGLHGSSQLSSHPQLGHLLETWVAQEVQKLVSVSSEEPTRLYGWRLQTGQEIDFLVERGGRLVALEVKWGGRVDRSVGSLSQRLQESLGSRLIGCVVLYGGKEPARLSPRLVAVPHAAFFSAVS